MSTSLFLHEYFSILMHNNPHTKRCVIASASDISQSLFVKKLRLNEIKINHWPTSLKGMQLTNTIRNRV